MLQYYKICHRKLWFFYNNINMDYSNEDMQIGKLIHKNSYSRENKEIRSDNMVFDYIKHDKDLTIFEIKKSSALAIGAKYQLYYYLYSMRKLNPGVKGELLYPKERKKEKLILTDSLIKEMDKILDDIPKIVQLDKPPKVHKKKYCKRCSFFELCMV